MPASRIRLSAAQIFCRTSGARPSVASSRMRSFGPPDDKLPVEVGRKPRAFIAGVGFQSGFFDGFLETCAVRRRAATYLGQLTHEILKLANARPVRQLAVARDDLVELHPQRLLNSVTPLPHRATSFQINVGIAAVEQQIAHVKDLVFYEQRHQVTIRVTPPRMQQPNGFVTPPDLVLVVEGVAWQEVARFTLPVLGIEVAQELQGSRS